MEKIYTINEIKAIVFPIARGYDIDRIFLFGSYANGTAAESSDIDFRVDIGRVRSFLKLGGGYILS